MNQRRHSSLIASCLKLEKRLTKGLYVTGPGTDKLFINLLTEYESSLNELAYAGVEWVGSKTVTEWHNSSG